MTTETTQTDKDAAAFDYCEHRRQAWEQLDELIDNASTDQARVPMTASSPAAWKRYEYYKGAIRGLQLDPTDYERAITRLCAALNL